MLHSKDNYKCWIWVIPPDSRKALAQPLPPSTLELEAANQHFSIIALLACGTRKSFIVRDFPVPCKMFSSIPVLYSLDPSHIHPPSLTTKNVWGHCNGPLGAIWPQDENRYTTWTEIFILKEDGRYMSITPSYPILYAKVPCWTYSMMLNAEVTVKRYFPWLGEVSPRRLLAVCTSPIGFSAPLILTRRSE